LFKEYLRENTWQNCIVSVFLTEEKKTVPKGDTIPEIILNIMYINPNAQHISGYLVVSSQQNLDLDVNLCMVKSNTYIYTLANFTF
jgi:hypothetical protein